METQFCLYNNLVNFQPSDFCSNVFKSVPRKYLRYKDDLNILVNVIQPRKITQHQTIQKKDNGCGTPPSMLVIKLLESENLWVSGHGFKGTLMNHIQ